MGARAESRGPAHRFACARKSGGGGACHLHLHGDATFFTADVLLVCVWRGLVAAGKAAKRGDARPRRIRRWCRAPGCCSLHLRGWEVQGGGRKGRGLLSRADAAGPCTCTASSCTDGGARGHGVVMHGVSGRAWIDMRCRVGVCPRTRRHPQGRAPHHVLHASDTRGVAHAPGHHSLDRLGR